MTNTMQKSLIKIAKVLNQAHVKWAVGASLMLHSLGLVEDVNDIDIVVALEDIDKVIEVLESIATHIPVPNKEEYVTRYFDSFNVDGVDMDVMAGFRIQHTEGIYEFLLDDASIVRRQTIEGIEIPYTSIEDWYVAYMLMLGREWKVSLIRDYLESEGVHHPALLKRTLDQPIPVNVKKKINTLLES